LPNLGKFGKFGSPGGALAFFPHGASSNFPRIVIGNPGEALVKFPQNCYWHPRQNPCEISPKPGIIGNPGEALVKFLKVSRVIKSQ